MSSGSGSGSGSHRLVADFTCPDGSTLPANSTLVIKQEKGQESSRSLTLI
jgi:hypothetical protein